MHRPGLSSLASALVVAALVAACSGGASPTGTSPGGSAQASPSTPASTPAASRPSDIVYATPVAPEGVHNGRIAAGVRASDGSANIFDALPDGTDVRQLTTGAGNHLCAAYSADGNLIAYCADVSGPFEIWTMKADGTEQTQVTHLNGRALKRIYPFQVLLASAATGLDRDSKAQAEQVRSISVERIGARLGAVPSPEMLDIDEALRVHLAL